MYSSVEEIRELLDSDINFIDLANAGMKRILNNRHSFHNRVDILLNHIGVMV